RVCNLQINTIMFHRLSLSSTMTTVDDVHRLISKTTTDLLTWVVAGLPVVACFPSKSDAELSEFLGMTTGRNDHEEDLQLWVALDQVSHQLFVTLTIRIKASTNRKPNRRLLYLVVPAEGLSLRSSATDYDSLNLPQDLFEIPYDVPSMKQKMLHMTFESTSELSYVVMQSYPNPPNLGFQAEILLRKLRHLSEASAFGLYADHAQDRQCALEFASSWHVICRSETPNLSLPRFVYEVFTLVADKVVSTTGNVRACARSLQQHIKYPVKRQKMHELDAPMTQARVGHRDTDIGHPAIQSTTRSTKELGVGGLDELSHPSE
ncbi:hypothetical protein KCU93_g10284, partial [Aureobasidium melanogenum]